jgi:hypothetical protein
MPAGQFSITVEQGVAFDLAVQVHSDDETPQDLTGYSARASVRIKYTDPAPTLVFTCAVTDAAQGRLSITATAAETDAMSLKQKITQALWDLELEAPDGKVDRLLEGTAWLSGGITR